ncbi:hypothetical protein CCUS01_06048 [Colletotrichum cuscutae]|uniref:Uncharacterized protein n=1 Tax=Colletotrichum cuscutae TaxID=1209917 RepID=A0AAI9V5L7_9PEZI|nr:hypothetical protein CCUS01_06048 [Colletotrichum cuscutae]
MIPPPEGGRFWGLEARRVGCHLLAPPGAFFDFIPTSSHRNKARVRETVKIWFPPLRPSRVAKKRESGR